MAPRYLSDMNEVAKYLGRLISVDLQESLGNASEAGRQALNQVEALLPDLPSGTLDPRRLSPSPRSIKNQKASMRGQAAQQVASRIRGENRPFSEEEVLALLEKARKELGKPDRQWEIYLLTYPLPWERTVVKLVTSRDDRAHALTKEIRDYYGLEKGERLETIHCSEALPFKCSLSEAMIHERDCLQEACIILGTPSRGREWFEMSGEVPTHKLAMLIRERVVRAESEPRKGEDPISEMFAV